jgi:hypothetical protein
MIAWNWRGTQLAKLLLHWPKKPPQGVTLRR